MEKDEIAKERETAAATAGAPDPKKRKRAAIEGAPGAGVCDDVFGNILARLPARTAVACTALSKRHCRLIRSAEFRSLHFRLAPPAPLPSPHIAYVATAPIRRRPEREPVSVFHGFHLAGAGLKGNDPVRTLAGGRYLRTSYAGTCNGVVLISGEEFSSPTRCTLWNPAVADDVKEVTVPDLCRNSTYLALALGYGRSSKTYKLLVCRKHVPRGSHFPGDGESRYKYSLLMYALGDADNPKWSPQLAELSARPKDQINLESVKTLYIDGTIYLRRFDEPAVVLAFDVDEETVSTIDMPGERPSQLLEMAGRPCALANDGRRRTLWLLTVDHRWERRCVIAEKRERYSWDDLLYCPIAGVWDCGDVLVLHFKDMPHKLCLYHVTTERMFKADLPGDLTPEWSDYEVCWGYRPTLVSPVSIVDKLNEAKELRRDRSVEIMQLLRPVKEQEMRKGWKATLGTVCFMDFMAYIMRKLPDGLQDLVEMPLINSEYSISFSEHTTEVADDGGGATATASDDDVYDDDGDDDANDDDDDNNVDR